MLFVLGLKSEESVKTRAGVRNHRPAEIQVCSYANNTVQTLGVGRIVSCLCSLRQPNIYCNLNESVVFVFMWSKLYFQHHYSSLQCHMIFRNQYNMLIEKPFWLLSMLRTVVLLPVFVETVIHVFSECFNEQKDQKNSISLQYKPFATLSLLSLLINLMHPCWIYINHADPQTFEQ